MDNNQVYASEIGSYPIKVVALGGLDENGKNCYVIEIDEDAFVIECGLKYPTNRMPGVDCIIPDFSYLKTISHRIKGVIITHGHDDQYGALPYLLNIVKAPIYATKTTIEVIKSTLTRFAKKFASTQFVTVKASDTVDIAGHTFELFQTTHSIAESFGFAIKTRFGNIVYTSDFISDYSPLKGYKFDLPKVARLAENDKTFLLLAESVSADKPGISSPNHKITELIKNEIEEPSGKIFVSIYTQNFYNIQEVINLAKKYKKKICIANSEQIPFFDAMRDAGSLVIDDDMRITTEQIKITASKDVIILVTGSGEKLYSFSKDICLGNIDNIKVETNDTWINCAPSVPGTEIAAVDASDTIFRTDCHVLTLSRKEVYSMHARQEDLKLMISLFRPRYYLPIKGEYRSLMKNAYLAIDLGIGLNHFNTFLFDNGIPLAFNEDGSVARINKMIKVGDVMIDGSSVGDVKEQAIEERTKMSDGGVVVIGLTISLSKKKILTVPDIQMRGFMYLKDSEPILNQVSSILTSTVQSMMDNSEKKLTAQDLSRKVSDKISRFIQKVSAKEPMVFAQIIDIDDLEACDPR